MVVVAAAAGVAAIRFLDQPSEDAAVDLVPADAYVYANLFIRPSGDQKRALDDLLSKFPEIESTDEAIDRLTELLDNELEGVGLSYEEDFDPWVGDQAAFFVTGEDVVTPDAAALLETTDPDAAREAIDKLREAEDAPEAEQRTYEGVDYSFEEGEGDEALAWGFVEDFLILGTENAFKAVVDTGEGADDAISESDDYAAAFDGLEDQNILSVYLDQGRLIDLLEESGEFGPDEAAVFNAFPGLRDVGSAGLVLSASSDGVSFESSSAIPEDDASFSALGGLYEGTDLLETLPADSWAALGIPNLGETARAFIDMISEVPGAEGASQEINAGVRQELGLDLDNDILGWMGDAALFVQGTNFQEMGGGVVIESNDSDATQAMVDRIRDRIETEQVPTNDESRGDYEGFSIQAGLPAPIYALVADRLVVTYGDDATDSAVEPEETLEGDETFQTASDELGEDYEPSLYVDIGSVLQVVDFARGFSGQADDAYEQEVKPWLDPLSYVIAGSKRDGDRIFQAYFVGVDEESS